MITSSAESQLGNRSGRRRRGTVRVIAGFHPYLENKLDAKNCQDGKVCGSSGSTSAGTGYNHLFVAFHLNRLGSPRAMSKLANKHPSRTGPNGTGDSALTKHDVIVHPFVEIWKKNSVPLRATPFEGVPGNEQVLDPVILSMRPGRLPKSCDLSITPETQRKINPIKSPDANQDSSEESAGASRSHIENVSPAKKVKA